MNRNNWLSFLSDDTPLSLINLPGTHDSCAQYIGLSAISRCQHKSIREQIGGGNRFLDIRLEYKDSRFYTVHGILDCRRAKSRRSPPLFFDEVFEACVGFLDENPTETVVMSIQMGDGKNGDDFFPAFFDGFVQPFRAKWFTQNRIPTLGETRGRLVLLRRCGLGKSDHRFSDDDAGMNFSLWPAQNGKDSFLPLSCEMALVSGQPSAYSAVIQDRFMVRPTMKWKKVVKPALENACPDARTVYLNFFSTAGFVWSPRCNSKYINAQFLKYPLTAGKPYGWCVFDFPDQSHIERVINSNLHTDEPLATDNKNGI